MNDILAIHEQANRLAAIHKTNLNYELDRQAREHDYPDWQTMLNAQLSHLQVALGLQKQWLRPATEEDGDVGGWPILPTYNPLLPEHLPPEGSGRDAYIQAIMALLIRTPATRQLAEIDKDYACRLGAAFLRWEIADALLEDRVPTLLEGGHVLRKLCEKLRAKGAEGNRFEDRLTKIFQETASERRASDPKGAALLEELASTGLGWRLSVLENTRRAFLRFRNPAIARLIA